LKRLVLLGGGHAHVEVLRTLALSPRPRWEVTVVSPTPWLTYSGMVPGHFAGHYQLDDCRVDLRGLCDRAQAKLLLTSATLASPASNEVVCANATVLPYEVLSVNVGAAANPGDARGVERHAIPLRPLDTAIEAWNEVLARANGRGAATVTVVGGGLAAIELAMAMDHRFRRDPRQRDAHVRVLGDSPMLAPALPAAARNALMQRMRRAGIEVHAESRVTEVGAGYLRLRTGLEFATDAVFWATGAAAPAWMRQSGFATDDQGFMLTNEFLQSPSHPNVFGAGDCVNVLGHALPKAGVFAVRAAPALAVNLMAALEGEALAPHLPKVRHLSLISAGEKYAIATWAGLTAEGRWAWRWKDRIDRRFVARYRADSPA
jgi:pyridine nucleotide-disulfide oxidoreductase family protein